MSIFKKRKIVAFLLTVAFIFNTMILSVSAASVSTTSFGTKKSIGKYEQVPSGWILVGSDITKNKVIEFIEGAPYDSQVAIDKSCVTNPLPSGWVISSSQVANPNYYIKCLNGAPFGSKVSIQKDCITNPLPEGWIVVTSSVGKLNYDIECLNGATNGQQVTIAPGVVNSTLPKGWTVVSSDKYYGTVIKYNVETPVPTPVPVITQTIACNPQNPTAGKTVTIIYNTNNIYRL